MNNNTQENVDFEDLFSRTMSKVNQRIKLTPQDKREGLKVYCQEPYAQKMYDALYSSKSSLMASSPVKDFAIGDILSVKAKKVSFADRVIEAVNLETGASVFIPFREYSFDPSSLVENEEQWNFKAMVYKKHQGTYYASEKKCAAIVYKDDMEDFVKNNKWFYVRVSELVKGGYLALYKNSIKCFLPGSHAAANVIHDFQEYLNKEIPVMIESYDEANKLFIVSYKKYIKQTLPQKIYDLSFTKEYRGRLTDKPHGIGMFVEFENYYTGLIHSSEFSDYDKSSKQYRAGDEISFYVKDIVFKKGEPRIVLTVDKNEVNSDRIKWQQLRDRIGGKTLEYTYSGGPTIEVELPNSNEWFDLEVNHTKLKDTLKSEGKIKISSVDILRQNIKFELL